MPKARKRLNWEDPKTAITQRSRIINALRKLWLYSRERQAALRRDQKTCQKCKRKEDKKNGTVSLRVHHICHDTDSIMWDKIIEAIRNELLCDPKYLITLCKECHDETHRVSGLTPELK